MALLDDDLIDIATREVLAEKKTRNQIGLEIKRKERLAVEFLFNKMKNEVTKIVASCL